MAMCIARARTALLTDMPRCSQVQVMMANRVEHLSSKRKNSWSLYVLIVVRRTYPGYQQGGPEPTLNSCNAAYVGRNSQDLGWDISMHSANELAACVRGQNLGISA